jgi:cobalt-zinc-cadmium efflux system protein
MGAIFQVSGNSSLRACLPGSGRDGKRDSVSQPDWHRVQQFMAHEHEHAAGAFDRAFAIGATFNTAFVFAEVVFGVLSGSLALVADAGHNLSDVLALLLAWGASALGRRQASARRTYGWGRSSILAAVTNALALLVIVGAVSWEAVRRLVDPEPVAGGVVIGVAALGMLINGGTALLFMSGRKHDVNLRGAFLHMASDAGVSLGVVVAGIVIVLTGWLWLDPAISLVIGAVVLLGTWGLLRDSVNLALDAVPEGVAIDAVRQYLMEVPGVVDLHDLHVWGMSTTETALTAHLMVIDAPQENRLLGEVAEQLHERFDIEHVTIQLERVDSEYFCPLETTHAVSSQEHGHSHQRTH